MRHKSPERNDYLSPPATRYVTPSNIDSILEVGAITEVHKDHFRFHPTSSPYLLSISSGMNIFHVLSAGAMELGNPIVSSAVEDLSAYKRSTWLRIHSTAVMLSDIALSEDPILAGVRIRDLHDRLQIRGLDIEGNPVPATDPYAYAMGWMPIVWMMEQTMKALKTTDEAMEYWYKESRLAFQCQSVADTYVPGTYAEYRSFMENVYQPGLVRTASIERIDREGIDPVPRLSTFWRGPVSALGNHAAHILTSSALPVDVRESFQAREIRPHHRVAVGTGKWLMRQWCSVAPASTRLHPHVAESISTNRLTRRVAGLVGRTADYLLTEPSRLKKPVMSSTPNEQK